MQFFALTEKEKSVIINHKLIITAMKKRSICGAFAESGWCEAAVRNREGHFGAVSQERVDASASINEGGTAEDFKSFRPLLNSEETGAFLVSIRPLQDTLVSPTEIRRN